MDQKPEDQKQDAAQNPQTPEQPNTASAAEGTQQPDSTLSTPPATPETPPTTPETPPTTSETPPTTSTETPTTDSQTPLPATGAGSTPPATPPTGTAPGNTKPAAKGKPKAMIVIIVMVLVFILAAGAYLYMTMQNKPKPMAAAKPVTLVTPTAVQVTAPPTPAISPVTSSNVDSTLDNNDAKVKQATDQATTDLNSVNKVNSSQDSTSGL
jgi:hypothetical protein